MVAQEEEAAREDLDAVNDGQGRDLVGRGFDPPWILPSSILLPPCLQQLITFQ